MKFFTPLISLLFLSVLFFVLGLIFYSNFYEFVVPDIIGVRYEMELRDVENNWMLFSLIVGLIPFFTFLTWEFSLITTLNKKLSTIFIILLSMIVTVFVRKQMLKSYLQSLVDSFSNKAITPNVQYSFDQMNIEYYLFGGLCMGCVISYMFFRSNNDFKKYYR